jgi:hypothetical protein
MPNRDDFSLQTKRASALRACYLCSFPDCKQLTVGPNDESPSSVTTIGVAAHICAAAPGGRRYDPSMSPGERSDIANAIWLCAKHATLIDRDSATYTTEFLRAMKRSHEAWCKEELRNGSGRLIPTDDLLAVGPDVVCVGKLIGVEESAWTLDLNHFVIGEFATLIQFIEGFENSLPENRYLLVNSIGDGRVLKGAPVLAKSETGNTLRCPVAGGFPRVAAQSLPADLALSTNGDLVLKNGDLALVSGVDALPQKIRLCLSLQRGELLFQPAFGTRLSEYFKAFRTSAWLERILKLEIIRQSAIPYNDAIQGRAYTPLQCVNRVESVEVMSREPEDQPLVLRVHLDVRGIGPWQSDISI